MSIPHHSTNAALALTYLDRGATRSQVAATLGITPSAVTQLTQDRSEAIDSKYDEIEDKLLDQLSRTIPLLVRPLEISKVLATVNAAKRRGYVRAENDTTPTRVMNLQLPTIIQNKFIVNKNNQVISAGAQELVTIQSANVPKLAEATHESTTTKEDEYGFTYP